MTASRKPLLTLCVIARNEEASIEACLSSASAIADEMVVVDTGSADSTPEIARRLGARVVLSPWEDDFSRARNAGLDEVRTPWVLMMDADERLEAADAGSLRRLLSGAAAGEDAFSVCIDNRLDGGGVAAFRAVRLFRHHPDIRYRGTIHEEVTSSMAERNGGPVQPQEAALTLIHEGYVWEARQARGKRDRNLSLLRRAIKVDERQALLHYTLARELLLVSGERIFPGEGFEDACASLDAAIKATRSESSPAHLKAAIYSCRAATLTADFRPSDALTLLSQAPPVGEGSSEAVLMDFARARARLAVAGEDHDLLRLAAREFESLDGTGPAAGFMDVDSRLTGVFARERRAEAMGRLGQRDAALKLLDEAAAAHPSYGGSLVRRAEILLLNGEAQAGLQAYADALKRDDHDPEAWLGTARLMTLLGEREQAADCAGNALQLVPLWGAALLELAVCRLLQNKVETLLEEQSNMREAAPEADIACLLGEALSDRPVTGLRPWPKVRVERSMMSITRGLAGGGRPDLLRQLQNTFGTAQAGAAATLPPTTAGS